jgi:membrane protease YdiL (CAAX protease family)
MTTPLTPYEIAAFAALVSALVCLWAPAFVRNRYAAPLWTIPVAGSLLAACAGGVIDRVGCPPPGTPPVSRPTRWRAMKSFEKVLLDSRAAAACVGPRIGLGYGWVFASTRSLAAAILTHAGLNAVHFVFFTYPGLRGVVAP